MADFETSLTLSVSGVLYQTVKGFWVNAGSKLRVSQRKALWILVTTVLSCVIVAPFLRVNCYYSKFDSSRS
jgi:hypothetical protein